jgi:cell division protein FtsB
MRILIIIVALTIGGLQYKLWLGSNNIWQFLQIKHRYKLVHQQNQASLNRNNALAADISELKSGDQALEEQARFELGMIKKGETYYQFLEKNH